MAEEPIYNEGYPEQQGWYDCLIDNTEEERLQHWVCPLAGRHHWKNIKGEYVEALHDVKWFGKPSVNP